jgi:hypothetical protein
MYITSYSGDILKIKQNTHLLMRTAQYKNSLFGSNILL